MGGEPRLDAECLLEPVDDGFMAGSPIRALQRSVVIQRYVAAAARPLARLADVTRNSTCNPARVAVFTSASRLN